MKVMVIAATKVDSKMGYDLLKNRGIEASMSYISESSKEQNDSQFMDKDFLFTKVKMIASGAKNEGFTHIFIYCNSLSSIIDYKKIEDEVDIPVITPLESYKEIASIYKNILVLAANSNSTNKIESIMSLSFPENIITIGILPLVNLIETNESPKNIYEILSLSSIIEFAQHLKLQNKKIDAIVLGCTHFPYIKKELEDHTDIPIVDPSEFMIKRLEKDDRN